LAAHRDRFRERTDLEIGVDRRRERAAQLDAFTLVSAETGEGRREGVDARTEILDPVLARAIGDGRTGLLDERRTGGFNRHTRQHAARRVFDDAGDAGLCERGTGKEEEERPDGKQTRDSKNSHTGNLAKSGRQFLGRGYTPRSAGAAM